MMKWAISLFIVVGVIAWISSIAYYQEFSRPQETANSASIAAPAPVVRRNAKDVEKHYKACVAAAEKSRDVTWETNCEQFNDGAAQAYNTCVTDHAMANNLDSIGDECETNCILPREVAKKIIETRDDAKAACLKNKRAEMAK